MSVWVGFLYTVVLSLPFSSGMIRMSRKDMEPSSLGSSLVNLMLESTELMWSKKVSLWSILMMVRVSSTYLLHRDGGCCDVFRALVSRSSMNKLAIMGLMGDPIAVPSNLYNKFSNKITVYNNLR